MDTKIGAGGAAGGLVAILIWVASIAGLEVDATTAASVAAAITAVVGVAGALEDQSRMTTVLTSIFSALLKAIITTLIFIWSGANLAKRKAAERGNKEANDANERREGLRASRDDDIDDRLRKSQQ